MRNKARKKRAVLKALDATEGFMCYTLRIKDGHQLQMTLSKHWLCKEQLIEWNVRIRHHDISAQFISNQVTRYNFMREMLSFSILHTIKTHEDLWVYANYQNQLKRWNSTGVTVDALIISILMDFLCFHICGHASILFDRISVEQIICLLPMSCIPTVTYAAWLPS